MVNPLRRLNEVFLNIENTTTWDLKSNLCWSFFFIDKSEEKLLALAEFLAAKGYYITEIGVLKEDDLMLQVEKIEINDLESLYMHECEMNLLAYRFNIHSYDGWNVGAIESSAQNKQ